MKIIEHVRYLARRIIPEIALLKVGDVIIELGSLDVYLVSLTPDDKVFLVNMDSGSRYSDTVTYLCTDGRVKFSDLVEENCGGWLFHSRTIERHEPERWIDESLRTFVDTSKNIAWDDE